jgi:archaellum component FlaC
MKEEDVKKLDILLESIRAHMNLFIFPMKEKTFDFAEIQLQRLESDIRELRRIFELAKGDKTSEEKEEK